MLSRSRLSFGTGEAQSLLCVACVVIDRLCCRAALWVGSGSAEALSWLSESEHGLLSSAAAAAACPILIPLAQGTSSFGGHFLPSAFFSRQEPLVATGHLNLCSHGSAGRGCQPGGTSSAQHWVLPAQPWCSAPAGNCLFFGCRYKSKDFYCQTEWEELVKKGLLTLFTAFSRDQVSAQRRRVGTRTFQAESCPAFGERGMGRGCAHGSAHNSAELGVGDTQHRAWPSSQCHLCHRSPLGQQ